MVLHRFSIVLIKLSLVSGRFSMFLTRFSMVLPRFSVAARAYVLQVCGCNDSRSASLWMQGLASYRAHILQVCGCKGSCSVACGRKASGPSIITNHYYQSSDIIITISSSASLRRPPTFHAIQSVIMQVMVFAIISQLMRHRALAEQSCHLHPAMNDDDVSNEQS